MQAQGLSSPELRFAPCAEGSACEGGHRSTRTCWLTVGGLLTRADAPLPYKGKISDSFF